MREALVGVDVTVVDSVGRLRCLFGPQVYCGNLDYDERAQDVERLFDDFGPIERTDMKTGSHFSMNRLCGSAFACKPLLTFALYIHVSKRESTQTVLLVTCVFLFLQDMHLFS